MRKVKLLSLAFALVIFLTSCSITNIDSDKLLTPPQMNAANQQILKCISSEIGSSYEPIYPQSGNYQNATVSIDLTGDGSNESVCFYEKDKTIGVIVLQQTDGKWQIKGKAESQATAIERIDFADLTNDNVLEVIIGWKYMSGEEHALEIFKFGDKKAMSSEYTSIYNNFVVFDNAVVVISRNTNGKTASAALISNGTTGIGILNTVALNTAITGFISVQSETNEKNKAIYIDEQLDSLMYATEVLIINDKNELSVTSAALSNQTMRTRAYICTDIDDDGSLDIPVERKLPEYERGGVTENLVYVDWHAYIGGNLEYIKSAYTSANEQFFIELPSQWIGKITVQRDNEIERAVHFYKLNENDIIPMFSIRVFSQQEFSENLQSLGWIALETVNENVYTFKADKSGLDEVFDVTEQEITEIFHLIS